MKVIFIIVVLIFTFGNVRNAAAQTEKRIQFAKGKSSATVSGATGTSGIYYNLSAKSGQKLVIILTPKSGVGIKVEKGEGEVLMREERGGTYEIALDESGNFTIFLGSISGKSVSFTMTVKITI